MPSSGPVLSKGIDVWAPGYSTGGRFTPAEAVAQARRFAVIGARPWTYRGEVGQMKAAAPDLVLLVYLNATFAQKGQADAYPASWYLRDANGDKVRSLAFGNYLMDPTNPAWVADRVQTCGRLLRASHYDGCLLDVVGTAPVHPWYVTGVPIDPTTSQPWTAAAWLQATTDLAAAVKAGNESAMVIGNGLGDGTRFFDPSTPSRSVLTGIDGGIAEAWLRAASGSIDRFPTAAAWKKSLDMLQATDKRVFVQTKLWTSGTQEQKRDWHRFALASFLLGNGGHAYFSFSESRTTSGVAPDELAARTDIGLPVAPYDRADGVYQRPYTRGLVLVNPTTATVTVPLDADYRDASGKVIRSVTLGPYGSEILPKA
jgi:hypothetical protein